MLAESDNEAVSLGQERHPHTMTEKQEVPEEDMDDQMDAGNIADDGPDAGDIDDEDKYAYLDDDFEGAPARTSSRTCERPGSFTGLVKGRQDAQNGAKKRVEGLAKKGRKNRDWR